MSEQSERLRAARIAAGERLKKARIAAGFRSGSDAAQAYGWKTPTYLGHENGSRGFDAGQAQVYAQKFGVNAAELVLGGAAPAAPPTPRQSNRREVPPRQTETIQEGAVGSITVDEARCREMLTSVLVLAGIGGDEARNIVAAILADCSKPSGRSASTGHLPLASTILKRSSSH